MDYFINQIIHFDTVNGLLKLIDNHDSTVQLPRPSSRLLTELITRSGKTITREDLLKSVWEDHGLRPSGSNLSNHISFLRKTFSQLGINENIIITVPKKGFRLEAEISLTRREPARNNNVIIRFSKIINIIFSLLQRRKNLTLTIKRSLLACLVAVFFILLFFTVKNYPFSAKMRKADFIGTCQIIDLSEESHSFREEKIKSLTLFIKEQKIDCRRRHSTIHFKFVNFFPRKDFDQKVIFITQCYQSSHQKLTHCENYFQQQ